MTELTKYNQRTLNIIATMLAGSGIDVRAVLSSRVADATAVLASKTVLLNPVSHALGDLAILAKLLRHRAERKREVGDKNRSGLDDWLTEQARTKWVQQALAELRSEYPNINCLPFNLIDNFAGIRVAAETAQLAPLSLGSAEPGTNFSLSVCPELDLSGADKDFACFLQALEQNALPESPTPGVPNLPCIQVPFRVVLDESGSDDQEQFETMLRDPEAQRSIASLEKCFRDRSIARTNLLPRGERSRHGQLDSERLVDAYVASKVPGGEVPTRTFRSRRSNIEPVFLPENHVQMIMFDLFDLASSEGRWLVQRMLIVFCEVARRLQMDLELIAFVQGLVKTRNGMKLVYFQTTVKRATDDFSPAHWSQLRYLLKNKMRLPSIGIRTCIHSLPFQRLIQASESILATGEKDYLHWTIWARRGLAGKYKFGPDRPLGFLKYDEIAREIDRRMAAFKERLGPDVQLDTLATFVPTDLKAAAHDPKGFLRTIEIDDD